MTEEVDIDSLMADVDKICTTIRSPHCSICGKDMTNNCNRVFRDVLSINNYEIFGMCQACQDEFFRVGDER